MQPCNENGGETVFIFPLERFGGGPRHDFLKEKVVDFLHWTTPVFFEALS